jgi:hypothetical protein
MIIIPMVLVSAVNGNKTSLGSITITNDGTGGKNSGNYDVVQLDKTGKRTVRKGRVERWPRHYRSPVQLLAAALKSLGY